MKRVAVIAGTAAATAAVLFAGNYHLFTSDALLPRIVPRVTFSFQEFIVNRDALLEMPPIVRAQHFPLSSMALERYWDRRAEGRN